MFYYDAHRMGENLRKCRGDKTLAEVAQKVGISVSSLQSYEIGARIPRDQVKLALADFYGRSVASIFYFDREYT